MALLDFMEARYPEPFNFGGWEDSGYKYMLNNLMPNNLCSSTTIKVETPKGFEKTLFTPKRIVKNGVATIVLWQDGTKTIVKRASDETESDYAAFTAALGIKCFGSNSALKRIVERTETQKPKQKKQNDNTGYRIVCPVCGNCFVKTQSEVRTKDGTLSTTCPSCRKFITVDF